METFLKEVLNMLPSKIDVCDHSFDISHLKSELARYVQGAKGLNPDRIYSVKIHYSNHVYSRSRSAHDAGYDFLDGARNERVFDYDRYLASYELPGIILGLMTAKIFHANDGSFMVTSRINQYGVDVDYDVY